MKTDINAMNEEDNDESGQMTTLSGIMEKLRVKGIANEFKWTPDGFTIGSGKFYQPEDLVIIKVYRFEGPSDPADNSILYVIKAKDELTGYNLDMYGMYSNHDEDSGYDDFIRKIPVLDHDEQIDFTEQ